MNQGGQTQPIIWPLLAKLNPMLAMQQQPKYTGGRMIPELPTLPWDDMDRPPTINYGRFDRAPTLSYTLPINFALCAIKAIPIYKNTYKPPIGKMPAVIREPVIPAQIFEILGQTLDGTGAVLPNCELDLYDSTGDGFLEETHSDGSGNYYFKAARRGRTHEVIAYKSGSPDVAGITVNTLTPNGPGS